MPIEASATFGSSGVPGGSAGFSRKLVILSGRVHIHHAEGRGLHRGARQAAHGHIRAA
jgi:hypothetical protein